MLAALVCVVAGSAASLTSSADVAKATTGFTAGDVVIYRVGDGSTALGTNGAPVFLDEYTPAGALVQSVPLPTTASGSNKPLVASGSANSEGELTLSADSRFLVATGYDAAVGTAGLSSSKAASVFRTVGLVNASDGVNTTTALNNFADQNNPRSAVTDTGTNLWLGGAAGGVAYATVGATSDTTLNATDKNVREVSIVDGQLYTSSDPTKAGALTVATVGTGLPTTATQTITNLPFSAAPAEPYGYSLLNLSSSSATTPDTLYVADNSAGAVLKYGLSGGTWQPEGSVPVPAVTGLTANDINGVVSIFATSSGSTGLTGELYSITDSSGAGGTLSGTANPIASAGATNEAFRGVAFAPGTVIGSGPPVGPPPSPPTITTSQANLTAAINDPTNPSLGITVGDVNYAASQVSLTATSSNTSVAPQSGISITGTGASRTLTLTPETVGYSTITLTATAPDNTTTTTSITYGVSAYLGDPSDRYFSGAGNGSAAIDVGGGYMIVGDDENNVLRLYNESQSGPPVKTFDFTSMLPYGTTEIDIEAAARSGNTLYWTGSMSNNSSGNLSPARSTLFAATISGSGANTTLTYLGSYTGLQSDLVNWDENNGSGLGASYFGFNNSVNGGVDSHEINALNVEGMEFAGSSSSTAYLAFRAPLEPTGSRHLALVIPVTNIDKLVTGAASTATFGTPMQWNLGGLGIRDIKENADGTYLIIAGTADGSNTSFVLYTWDGNPNDAPQESNTTLPLVPAGANQGSWETIVSVPDPLTSGSAVQLLEDNGDTAWYGDTATSKSGLPADLQKDLGRVFTYSAPSNPYDASVLASSPSDYWSLDDTGTTLTDEVGTSNGSYLGIGGATPSRSGVTLVPGATPADGGNTATYFNGGYADIPNGSAALTGSAFTLEFWTQDPANDCNGADYCPSLIGGGSFGGGGFYYVTSVNGTLYFFSSAGFVESSCNLGFDTTTWHQVAVTGDGTNLDIYVDGQLCGARTSSGPLSLSSADLVLGNDPSKSLADESVGPIDDVATYPRALPASEIAAHFAAATSGSGGSGAVKHPAFTTAAAHHHHHPRRHHQGSRAGHRRR
jgi:hypothetical protein